jgi:hypothetical protein
VQGYCSVSYSSIKKSGTQGLELEPAFHSAKLAMKYFVHIRSGQLSSKQTGFCNANFKVRVLLERRNNKKTYKSGRYLFDLIFLSNVISTGIPVLE